MDDSSHKRKHAIETMIDKFRSSSSHDIKDRATDEDTDSTKRPRIRDSVSGSLSKSAPNHDTITAGNSQICYGHG